MGAEDGVVKTPAWAEAKSGVPAGTIVSLAREYATRKPAALVPGFAPGRTAYGEQFHRMAAVLAAMTGNVGIHGGSAAGFDRPRVGPMVPPGLSRHFEGLSYDKRLKQLDVHSHLRKRPHFSCLWDCIIEGTAGGYPVDLRMAYFLCSNPLNQLPHINRGVQALKKLEFIVVHEQFMSATARFADILLPTSMVWERNDIARPWLGGPYFLYLNKAIEPPPDVRTNRDICRGLAARLGIQVPLLDMPDDDAIRQMAEVMEDVMPEVVDFDRFKQAGVHKIRRSEPQIAFKEQIEDPDHNPFPTPSGKIEIYSQLAADLKNPEIPPIPKHIDSWEGPEDLLAKEYPLQLLTYHHRARAHSVFDNNPWLREIEQQGLIMSCIDARARGIQDREMVRVFNGRGETVVRANVTERIMPGVVALGEGAWYSPDKSGRDHAGSPNILTRDRYSPGGATPYNNALVQVEKA